MTRVPGKEGPGRERDRARLRAQVGGAVAAAAAGALVPAVIALWADIVWVGIAVSSVLLALGLILLLFALRTLKELREDAGTVYFVRYQFPGLANWHRNGLRRLTDGRLDLRVVTREVTGRPTGGVLDIVDDIHEMAIALETATNTDDAGSGFHFAPDLQWPAALSLGTQMYGQWEHQTMNELVRDASLENGSPIELNWHLLSPPEQSSRWYDPKVRSWHAGDAPPPEAIVAVTANLTDRINLDPEQLPLLRLAGTPDPYSGWYGVGAYPEANSEGATTWRTRCLPVIMSDESGLTSGSVSESNSGEGARTVHPWVATARCVQAIRMALHEHPHDLVFFFAQLPKTVAVAVGWHLVRDELTTTPAGPDDIPRPHLREWEPLYHDRAGKPVYRCLRTCCIDPWRRLIPVFFEQRTQSDGQMSTNNVLVRAHPSQPPNYVLLPLVRRANNRGSDFSGTAS